MWTIIVDVALAVLSIALAVVSYYFDVKKRLVEGANKAIAKVEDPDKEGKEKMAVVVDKLYYDIVPKVLRPLFSKQKIEAIVQKLFNEIEEYAQKQVKDKKA